MNYCINHSVSISSDPFPSSVCYVDDDGHWVTVAIGAVVGGIWGGVTGGWGGGIRGAVSGAIGGIVSGAMEGAGMNPVYALMVGGGTASIIAQLLQGENPFRWRNAAKTAANCMVCGVLGKVSGKATRIYWETLAGLAVGTSTTVGDVAVDTVSRAKDYVNRLGEYHERKYEEFEKNCP